MTDPESILQLGIEAARDGNKEEARNLFRLLTREDPRNVQAWIWLAGVAENREERRSALEQVLQLEPDNQLALKGLQALDDQPGSQSTNQQSTPQHEPAPVPPPEPEPSSQSSYDRYADMDEDDPFAELDSLSEVFQEDPGAVRRDEPASTAQQPETSDETPMGDSRSAAERDTTTSRSKPAAAGGGRSTSSSSRSSSSRRSSTKKEKGPMPANTNSQIPRVALIALIALLLIVGLIFVFRDNLPLIGNGGGGGQPPAAEQPPAEQPPAEQPPAEQPPAEQPPAEQPPAEQPPAEQPPAEQPPAEQPPAEQPPAEQPTITPIPGEQPAEPAPAEQPPAPADGDVAAANPAIVPPGTPLEANGWAYDFPGWPPGPVLNIGEFNGRFIIVITNIINNTGQEQPIPPDFFVLKDGQGRTYTPRADVSSAFLGSGGLADLSLQDPVPADGITRSVPVIFDIAPDAENLVFFSRYNTGQGWQIR